MEGSPQTHKPSPIPAQKLMSAGWNWPHSGCGQGADTKEADSAHSQIIFTVFPCWNSWEGCSGNGSSSIRSFSSSPVRSEQQRESGNSCTGGSGLGSSAGRISVGAVSGMLASPPCYGYSAISQLSSWSCLLRLERGLQLLSDQPK